MNRTETFKILSVLKVAYPNSYKDTTDSDIEATAKLWQSMFETQPYVIVAAALKALIATSKWVPTIAEVNEKIYALTAPPELDEAEAWELVHKAIGNSGYESKKEFEKLPDSVRRIIGSPNTLKELAMMDIQTVQSVEKSHFVRSYRARAAAGKEFNMLPESTKKMFAECAGKIKSLPDEADR